MSGQDRIDDRFLTWSQRVESEDLPQRCGDRIGASYAAPAGTPSGCGVAHRRDF
jgi:hypothetical protein